MTTRPLLVLKKNSFTILFVGWILLVTTLSLFSFSGIETEEVYFKIPHIDKITHFVFYFFFVVFGFFFLKERSFPRKTSKSVWLLMITAIFYGLLMEFLQWLMPFDRMPEIWDALANSIGALMGGLLVKKYHSRIYTPK